MSSGSRDIETQDQFGNLDEGAYDFADAGTYGIALSSYMLRTMALNCNSMATKAEQIFAANWPIRTTFSGGTGLNTMMISTAGAQTIAVYPTEVPKNPLARKMTIVCRAYIPSGATCTLFVGTEEHDIMKQGAWLTRPGYYMSMSGTLSWVTYTLTDIPINNKDYEVLSIKLSSTANACYAETNTGTYGTPLARTAMGGIDSAGDLWYSAGTSTWTSSLADGEHYVHFMDSAGANIGITPRLITDVLPNGIQSANPVLRFSPGLRDDEKKIASTEGWYVQISTGVVARIASIMAYTQEVSY